MKVVFQTLSTDLTEYAEAACDYFKGLGYSVSIEPSELGYPRTPAFKCTRNHTTVIVEVCETPKMKVIKDWVSLGKSTNKDIRIAICIPDSAQRHLPKFQKDCKALGVGIYVATSSEVQELFTPSDLGLNVHLPSLSNYSGAVRKALGSAYEQFRRNQWREGFEEACKALEQRARTYLKTAIRRQRLKILDGKGKLNNPSNTKIDRMTIGELAIAFSKAQPQNATDSLVQRTLASVNRDRIGVAHKINRIKTESSLRSNVGVHMHAIIQALNQIC